MAAVNGTSPAEAEDDAEVTNVAVWAATASVVAACLLALVLGALLRSGLLRRLAQQSRRGGRPPKAEREGLPPAARAGLDDSTSRAPRPLLGAGLDEVSAYRPDDATSELSRRASEASSEVTVLTLPGVLPDEGDEGEGPGAPGAPEPPCWAAHTSQSLATLLLAESGPTLRAAAVSETPPPALGCDAPMGSGSSRGRRRRRRRHDSSLSSASDAEDSGGSGTDPDMPSLVPLSPPQDFGQTLTDCDHLLDGLGESKPGLWIDALGQPWPLVDAGGDTPVGWRSGDGSPGSLFNRCWGRGALSGAIKCAAEQAAHTSDGESASSTAPGDAALDTPAGSNESSTPAGSDASGRSR